MKAILGYHYPTGKWCVIDLIAGVLSTTADVYERCQVDPLQYTKFITASVRKIDIDDIGGFTVELEEGFKLPEVETLEDSIEKSIRVLSGYNLK